MLKPLKVVWISPQDPLLKNVKSTKHPKCLGYKDEYLGDYDCDYGTTLTCDECKYGTGKKNPAAKVNQI